MFRLTLPALLVLSACASGRPDVARFVEPMLRATGEQQVDLTRPEICQSRDETPAIVETVTESRAGADGRYQTRTTHRIVAARDEIWFDTPCRDAWTPEFIASVQRALIVRGYMAGPATGTIDRSTRRAIRAFQKVEGIDSDVLSIAAGKRLGLIVYDRDEAMAKR
ncbi:Putative peptidoglycan binding domain-containing protein [Palleronia marisminoris]|uniref:Putative peptidoglycan binding domain protein n=1 Tax=Palleronia marisminoris TaxID=315423 RepID=A0A1Y5SV08_9RHOB|nr:peptidoglycan-binding domain-containing protein [Palleronia marisminoris]SFG99333.1 Putative peptidoglycan binding domain-containing protein [Palleronia marisminoris]SLN48479.1 Putative peptidoglycan binding domain protein [Palleronia marisminoris]